MGVNTIRSQKEKILLDVNELRVFGGGFRRSDCGPRNPSKIFVCSTIEIFHPAIPKDWRDDIFRLIEKNKRHAFQILTKMPENIDRDMPDNVWLGVSITGDGDIDRAVYLYGIKAKVKFISYEPLLGDPLPRGWGIQKYINWVIIGRLTGYGNRHNPDSENIRYIIEKCEEKEIPIFLKENLKDIWGEKLIQEFPE